MIQKFLAKEFIWVLIAIVLSFPLALVPLTILEYIIQDIDAFLVKINDDVIVLYGLLVATCFVGILLIRIVSSSIRTLFSGKQNE